MDRRRLRDPDSTDWRAADLQDWLLVASFFGLALLSGNLTIVGASANVVVANLAARSGYPIRFTEFLRYGSVVVVISLVISTAYISLRYL